MKKQRAKILFALAALCGLGTATTARNVLNNQVEPILTKPVLLAQEALPPGDGATSMQTHVVQWPSEMVPAGALPNAAAMQGRVLARPVAAGEPILESAFLPEGREAGLDGLIGKNMRAVSVKVDEFVGVGGFLQPGARVDIMTTAQTTSGSGENTSRRSETTVILENLKVLAVDDRLVRTEGGATEEIKVATLEVDSGQAAVLAHAEHDGRLKLALRGQGDETEGTRPVRMVLGTDVRDVRF